MSESVSTAESTDQVQDAAVWRTLQRLILPTEPDPDVLPLYVDASVAAVAATESVESEAAGAAGTGSLGSFSPGQIEGRHAVRIPGGERLSFGTYFNAFPAGYWRRWSVVSDVRLRVTVQGEGATITIFRSLANGRSQWVESQVVEGESQTFDFDLPLKPFGDGGWYWYDVVAGNDEARVVAAEWTAEVPADRAQAGTATVGITTMNRPEFIGKLLMQLGEDPEVSGLLDEVLVMDQGSQKVVDGELYPAAEEALAGRLKVLEQGNLGGSGGFARAQLEALEADRSTYVLFLDDDIVLEPEGILRAITFGDLARRPTIVGGHMFSLFARSRLHSLGEIVQPWRFWWQSPAFTRTDWDLSVRNLRSARWMHRRVDVDFNPWFMCLIPMEVVREIGLSLPIFIKWDDLEYGVRAKAAGYPTVTFPGAAVWHVPWTDKNDALDWQAYFHLRNRFIAALLHSEYPRGGRMVRESFNHQIKHLISMEYSVVEMRHQALLDVLDGPDRLHETLPTRLPEIRELRKQFVDAQVQPHQEAFPPVKRRKPPKREGLQSDRPPRVASQILSAGAALARQLRKPSPMSRQHPEAHVSAMDAKWYRLSQYDSAIVSLPDGSSVALYQRDDERSRDLFRRTVAIHQRLHREWPRLSAEYQQKLAQVTSPEAWAKTLEPWRESQSPAEDGESSID